MSMQEQAAAAQQNLEEIFDSVQARKGKAYTTLLNLALQVTNLARGYNMMLFSVTPPEHHTALETQTDKLSQGCVLNAITNGIQLYLSDFAPSKKYEEVTKELMDDLGVVLKRITYEENKMGEALNKDLGEEG